MRDGCVIQLEQQTHNMKQHTPAPSKGSRMEAPTLLRDLLWTPLEGPGGNDYNFIFQCLFKARDVESL